MKAVPPQPPSIESIRAELQALDVALVAELLSPSAVGQGGDSAPDADGPFGDLSARFPEIGRTLRLACAPALLATWRRNEDSAASALLRKRIALGASVAETKHRDDPERFSEPIRRRDRAALRALITYPEVERRVIDRAMALAAETGSPEAARSIGTLFREVVIPLTKDVQVAVLLHFGDRA